MLQKYLTLKDRKGHEGFLFLPHNVHHSPKAYADHVDQCVYEVDDEDTHTHNTDLSGNDQVDNNP